MDSNSLIAIAQQILNFQVHGFTITSDDQRYDESVVARQSANDMGIRHTEVRLNKESFINNLRNLVAAHDGPVCTITYYTQWLLMKEIASNGYKVSVSGTGADELFTGYYDHFLAQLYELKNDRLLFDSAKSAWIEHIRPIVRNPFLQDPDYFINNPTSRDHIYLGQEIFSSYLKQTWLEEFVEEFYSKDLLRNRMANELFHENVPPILHEDDLNAMYFSIENRSPFLDRKLFEYASSIPTRLLINNGFGKSILRDAVQGIVPDCIVQQRRKVGFNASILSLLDTKCDKNLEFLLEDSPIYELVDRQKISNLLTREQFPNSESKFLFSFINAKLFLEDKK